MCGSFFRLGPFKYIAVNYLYCTIANKKDCRPLVSATCGVHKITILKLLQYKQASAYLYKHRLHVTLLFIQHVTFFILVIIRLHIAISSTLKYLCTF